jgi:ribonuclease D
MGDREKDGKNCSAAGNRELVVAYLTYALKDVRALNAVSAHLLEMTIEALNEEATEQTEPPTEAALCN